VTAVVRADTPTRPIDVYSATKLEAEQCVRASSLEWVVLRLGAVLSPDFSALPLSADGIFIESALPTDNRIHTVDVRDVASAFAAATTADVAREILLIAGDDSHKLLQKDVGPSLAAALGLPGVIPEGRPGDPNNDDGWFLTDWMDTDRAQQALGFQRHSWPAMLDEIRTQMGWKRYVLSLVAPLARIFLAHRAAYRNAPGQYADLWGAIRARLGEPGVDSQQPGG
jgi:nucleoside-diphosphate-sugar epimerase